MGRVRVIAKILRRIATPDNQVIFSHGTDENGIVLADLYLSRLEWEEMGEPEIVTVTIQPGDRLNQGDLSYGN